MNDEARAIVPIFDADRLKLARDARGWTQREVARRARTVTPAAISQFEKRQARPSAKTLARLAEALDFPVQFFGQASSASLPNTDGFFRSLRSTPKRARASALARANLVRQIVIALERHLSLPSLNLMIRRTSSKAEMDEIADAANFVRKQWGIPEGPIKHVVRTLERNGIVTTRFAASDQRIDAFSVPFPDRPIVVLGSDKGNLERSRFDGSHELGHLIMHDESACGTRWAEQQAHWFAAAYLMPAEQIVDELPRKLDWSDLARLKVRWRVSIAALLLRARQLGIMDESVYVHGMKVMSARGWRKNEPVDLGPPESPLLLTKSVQQLEEEGTTIEDLAQEAALPIRDLKLLLGTSRDPRPAVAI